MFEKFTERARQVVVFGQDEARALGHDHIGTEHLLLGLLREEEGIAARVLESLDITVEEVRAQVVRVVGEREAVATGQIPFTPRAKKALELGLREALALGHNHVGTEHILLGLVRVNEAVAARILLDFDADAEKVRTEVVRRLSGRRGGEPRPAQWPRETQVYPLESAGQVSIDLWPEWEYEILAVGDAAALTVDVLNARGAEGWELVAVAGEPGDQRLIFKRAKRD